MIKKRKQYSPEFKAKVQLAAIRNEVVWQDEQGLMHKQPPLYFGLFRSKEGIAVYQGLQKIVLTIQKNDNENHIRVGLDIFHRHTSKFSQEFKYCNLRNCHVFKAVMEVS